MYMCFGALVPMWNESGYGIVLGDKCYTHLIWADNIWLLSHDLGHTQTMLNSLTEMLSESLSATLSGNLIRYRSCAA